MPVILKVVVEFTVDAFTRSVYMNEIAEGNFVYCLSRKIRKAAALRASCKQCTVSPFHVLTESFNAVRIIVMVNFPFFPFL